MLSTDEIRALIQRIVSDNELQTEFRRAILPDEEYNLLKAVRELIVKVADLTIAVENLAEAQKRTEERIEQLAEAQRRTEQRVEELAEAQRRTEERVEELAEAQRRTEERVGRLEIALAELAEAQRRTEKRVEELAEAQRRTEERVGRLEIALAELAEAQRRTEQRVEELAEAQRRTEERVGRLEIAMEKLAEAQEKTWSKLARLDERIGVSTEQEAADMLGYVLRHKGYEILSGPFNLHLNSEIDVIYTVQDGAGRRLTAVLEAKTRLGYSVVERWAQAMRSEGLRRRLAENGFEGPYLVYVYGMRADPSSYEAAKAFGIGLITDRGEQIEPAGEIPAS